MSKRRPFGNDHILHRLTYCCRHVQCFSHFSCPILPQPNPPFSYLFAPFPAPSSFPMSDKEKFVKTRKNQRVGGKNTVLILTPLWMDLGDIFVILGSFVIFVIQKFQVATAMFSPALESCVCYQSTPKEPPWPPWVSTSEVPLPSFANNPPFHNLKPHMATTNTNTAA